MKRTIYFLFALLLSGTIFMGCEEKLVDDPTADKVAEDMASALGTSNSGISSEIQGASLLVNLYQFDDSKSATIDTIYRVETSFTNSNTEGALITFSYDYDVNWGIVFEDYLLRNVYYNSIISGSFDAPRISSTDSRNTNWIITGLLQSTEFILNGESERTGTAQSKIGNEAEIVSTSNIVFNDITIDKETLEITGGSLDWEINGTLDDVSFSYSATVVYLGDGMAQININGHKYSIDIEVGEIEE